MLTGPGIRAVVLDDELVAAELSFVPFAGPSCVESDFGRAPIVVITATGCASICLGIARAAVEELISLGRRRLSPDPEPDPRDRPAMQSPVARASTLLSALPSLCLQRPEVVLTRPSRPVMFDAVDGGDADI